MRPRPAVRRSDRVLLVLALLGVCVAGTWLDGVRLRAQRQGIVARNQRLAADLRLTDICLFGGAPWLRHLSQGDVLASIQDGPLAFDYAWGGSLVAPRRMVVGSDGPMAQPSALPR